MMQRTILMVTNNYAPYSGGVVSSVLVTVNALRSSGHRVIIVTLDFVGNSPHEEDLIRIYCPIRFIYRNNHMAIPWRAQNALERIVTTYKPDIIHVHHPFLLGICAQKVGKRLGIPVVFTFHTLYERYVHYIPLPQWLVKPFVQYLVKGFCKKADAIIAPSESIKSYIAQKFSNAAQSVPSAILPCFTADKILEKNMQQPYRELLSVSRFTSEKNILFLFRALKLLGKNYRLTLIGYGVQQQELENYAYQTAQLSKEQVQFIVKPPKDTIAQWYKNAHLFVFASTSETQGLVLAEAMAAGTPVVAVRGSGVVDIVENGKNGFVVDSESEMAQRIQEIMQNAMLYQRLRQGAFETAKNYHPEQAAQKLLAVYDAVLQKMLATKIVIRKFNEVQ